MRIYREITPVRKDDVFIIRNHPNPDFNYPIHNHPEYELNLVLNCLGNRIIGDSVAKYSTNPMLNGTTGGFVVWFSWKQNNAKNQNSGLSAGDGSLNVPYIQLTAKITANSLFLGNQTT